jgi:kynureninase
MTTRDDCLRRDAADPLRRFRDRFHLPDGLVYLDGNSLGPLPRELPARLHATLAREWGEGLIRSWNDADWIGLPRRLGAAIAPLIGARPHEVIVADSTSINLYKLLLGGLALRPGRQVVLAEAGTFPTDLYMAEGAAARAAGIVVRRVESDAELLAAIDETVAVVMLTHVDFRSGRLHDMAVVTAAAHAAGALVLWDLAHSVGALPIALNEAGADLAVGCTYKYLNGGPGAPAFLYVAEALQASLPAALPGWLGHARPFDFAADYEAAPGIDRQLCGTPPVLSMAALQAALALWPEVDMAALRAKSQALTGLFIDLVEARCPGLELATPREPDRRGSQVAFRHPEGYAIVQALIGRDVIGDFRTPDLLRFGFAPLYVRYVDVWDAVERLASVLAEEAWRDPRYRARAAVT